jgi:hypothetical protein
VSDVIAAASLIADSPTASELDPKTAHFSLHRHVEEKISKEQDERRAARVLGAFPTKSEKEFFVSGATTEAAAALTPVGPTYSRTVYSDDEYKAMCRGRLQLVPVAGSCAKCSRPEQGRLVPHSLHHAHRCVGGLPIARHNAVRDVIAEAARQIRGARVVVEPRVHADVGLARKVGAPAPNIDHRGDVYIEVDDPKRQKTHRWLVDVVISHSHSPASELAPPSAPGTGAAAAAKKKRDLYAANYVTGSVTVVPFSCETGGHIDAPGVALLKMLSRLNYEAKVRNALAGGGVNPLAYPVLVRRLTEKVAVAIQRGNAMDRERVHARRGREVPAGRGSFGSSSSPGSRRSSSCRATARPARR